VFHTTGSIGRLSREHLEHLLTFSRPVTFEPGTRLFEEGRPAENFWLVEGGSVRLDMHVPGRRAAAVDILGTGELVGWSWMFPPYRWHLGAEAVGAVRALEFDAEAVRAACANDPEFGCAITLGCAQVIAGRLQASRLRLLDLFGPHGSAARDPAES
jgi:CRP-like cAMP-binding protein